MLALAALLALQDAAEPTAPILQTVSKRVLDDIEKSPDPRDAYDRAAARVRDRFVEDGAVLRTLRSAVARKAVVEDPRGRAALARASESRDRRALRGLVPSLDPEVAGAALDLLGAIALDRGEFEEAAGCWARLLYDTPESAIPAELVAAKLGLAWSLAGRTDEVRRVLREAIRLRLDGTVRAGDRLVALRDFLDALIERPAGRPLPKPDVPDVPVRPEPFSGPSCTFLLGAHKDLGTGGGTPVQGGGEPALDGTVLYVPLRDAVVAVRLGDVPAVAWTHEVQDARGSRLGVLGACVSEGRVVATGYGDGAWPSVVRALRRSDGREVWATDDETIRKALGVGGQLMIAPPVAAGGRVCLAVNDSDGTSHDGASVVGLHPDTGAIVWTRKLGYAMSAGAPPAAAVHGGLLYVATNLGMLAALDPRDGEVLWMATYKRLPLRAMGRRQPPRMAKLAFPRAAGPPVFAAGGVFHLPLDGALVGFDAWTGARLSLPDTEAMSLSHLLAVDGLLFAAGDGRSLLEIEPVAVSAKSHRLPVPSVTRLAAGSGFLFAMGETGLVARFNLGSDTVDEVARVALREDTVLRVVEDRVVFAGGQVSVHGYSPEFLKAARCLRDGAPLGAAQALAYAEGLWTMERHLEGTDAFLEFLELARGDASMEAKAKEVRERTIRFARQLMRSDRPMEERVAFAKRVEALAVTEEERADAMLARAEALMKLGRDEEVLEPLLGVLAETATPPPEGGFLQTVRQGARYELWRLARRSQTAREAIETRAAAAARGAADADALLRVAASFPYTEASLEAFAGAAKKIRDAAAAERCADLVLEVEMRWTREQRGRVAAAMASALEGSEDARLHKALQHVIEWLRR
jgi:outer membrane protein assembly factor BamB